MEKINYSVLPLVFETLTFIVLILPGNKFNHNRQNWFVQNVKSEYKQEEFKALKGGQLIGSVKSVQKIHMLFKKKFT